jgi:hypothetical protein
VLWKYVGSYEWLLFSRLSAGELPLSPGTKESLSPGSKGSMSPMSPGAAVRNVKAETIAEAHRERVEAEARAYLQSETRKAEARAATAQVKQLQ